VAQQQSLKRLCHAIGRLALWLGVQCAQVQSLTTAEPVLCKAWQVNAPSSNRPKGSERLSVDPGHEAACQNKPASQGTPMTHLHASASAGLDGASFRMKAARAGGGLKGFEKSDDLSKARKSTARKFR
jgi:hypothetical protein